MNNAIVCMVPQDTNAGVVTAAVAMVTHKWVESIALSSMCLRARAEIWQIFLVLLPFGVMAFVGVAIGVAVTDTSSATEMVLFGLISGGLPLPFLFLDFIPCFHFVTCFPTPSLFCCALSPY